MPAFRRPVPASLALRAILAICAVLLLGFVTGQSGFAQDQPKRRALVIGIDGYTSPALRIPGNRTGEDALRVAAVLSNDARYDTVEVVPRDADKAAFTEALARFIDTIQPGDLVLVFYSGHGVEFDRDNYLLLSGTRTPLAADDLRKRAELETNAVSQLGLIRELKRRQPGNIVLVINACRNDVGESVSLGDGDFDLLGPSSNVAAPIGTMVIYATSSGTPALVCLDRDCSSDTNPMTVFTRRFVEALAVPNLPARDLYEQVGEAVEEDVATALNEVQLVSADDQTSHRLRNTLFLGPVHQASIDVLPHSPVDEPSTRPTDTATPTPTFGLDSLYSAALAEGQLTVIALPHDWCNFGGVIEGFKAKYPGIGVNELNPDAGSRDEVEAIQASINSSGPEAPDVVDVGPAFAAQLVSDKLAQPYKVSTWDSIPASVKHPDGYWYGDYFGVQSFLVNTDRVRKVPRTWADLTDPAYSGQVALAGDPRTSNQAMVAVQAAGLAAGADSDATAIAGLRFFAGLNRSGNLVAQIGRQASFMDGSAAIIAGWDYNLRAWQASSGGNPGSRFVVPSDAVVGGYYVQAISAYAPHPNAAKLWMEYLYSDEGQLGWLAGYCTPIRIADMLARGVVPDGMLGDANAAQLYARVVFPSLEAQAEAKAAIVNGWDSIVGADIR